MNITEDNIDLRQDSSGYYLTSDLTQRLDLISHLLANTDLIPFVQSAEGCGKTRLARHLADSLAERYTVSLVSGGPMAGITDLRAALAEIAGLPGSEISDDLLEEQFCRLADNKKNFLLLLDDADQLAADSLSWLIQFFSDQKIACNTKCVIFSAVDVLALPLGPVQLGRLKGVIQVLDIPRFNFEQMRGFIDFVRGDKLEPLSDAQIAVLEKQTRGVPGKVLWQLQFADIQATTDDLQSKKAEPWLKPLLVAAIAGFVITVGSIMYFQDEINQFIVGDDSESSSDEAELQTLVIPPQKPLPQVVTGDAEPEPELVEKSELYIPGAMQDRLEPASEIAPLSVPVAEVKSTPVSESTPAPQTADDIQDATGVVEQVAQGQVEQQPAVEKVGDDAQEITETEVKSEPEVKTVSSTVKEAPVTVVKTVKTKAVNKSVIPPVPPAPSVPASPPAAPEVYKSVDWLYSHNDEAYTLQLLAVSDRSGIDRFVNQHKFNGDLVILTTVRDEKPWYALLYGAFPSRDKAVAAKKKLPKSYKSSSAWPRSVNSLKQASPSN